jgi:hypothetical protein
VDIVLKKGIRLDRQVARAHLHRQRLGAPVLLRRAKRDIGDALVDQPVEADHARLGQRVLGDLLHLCGVLARGCHKCQQQEILRAAPHHHIAQEADMAAQVVVGQAQGDRALVEAARHSEGRRRDQVALV